MEGARQIMSSFSDLADWTSTTPKQLVETHLAKTSNTARGYAQDLDVFAGWMAKRENTDHPTAIERHEAARRLIDNGRAAAKRMLISWINDMRAKHLSASTIRRRIASIRSLISLASDPDIEIIGWQIGRLPNLPPAGRVRDVRGPDRQTVLRMLAACRDRHDHVGARNEAILSLLYYHGLRANECLSIRMSDVDLATSPPSIRILAKRGEGRIALSLCRAAADAIENWIGYRGSDSGPLFLNCVRVARRKKKSNPNPGKARVTFDRRLKCRKLVTRRPLSYWGMRGMVRRLGERAGCRCWPHGLRHAAISHLASLTNDSPVWGVALSRHADVRAWAAYQDRQVSHLSAAEVLSRGQIVESQPVGADN